MGPEAPKSANEPDVVMDEGLVYETLPSPQFTQNLETMETDSEENLAKNVSQSSVMNTLEIANKQKKSLENTEKESLKKTALAQSTKHAENTWWADKRKYEEYNPVTKTIDETSVQETIKSTENTNSTSDAANKGSMEKAEIHFKSQYVTEQTDLTKMTFRRIDFSKGVTARPLNFDFGDNLPSELQDNPTSKLQSKHFEPILESMENSQMIGGIK